MLLMFLLLFQLMLLLLLFIWKLLSMSMLIVIPAGLILFKRIISNHVDAGT